MTDRSPGLLQRVFSIVCCASPIVRKDVVQDESDHCHAEGKLDYSFPAGEIAEQVTYHPLSQHLRQHDEFQSHADSRGAATNDHASHICFSGAIALPSTMPPQSRSEADLRVANDTPDSKYSAEKCRSLDSSREKLTGKSVILESGTTIGSTPSISYKRGKQSPQAPTARLDDMSEVTHTLSQPGPYLRKPSEGKSSEGSSEKDYVVGELAQIPARKSRDEGRSIAASTETSGSGQAIQEGLVGAAGASVPKGPPRKRPSQLVQQEQQRQAALQRKAMAQRGQAASANSSQTNSTVNSGANNLGDKDKVPGEPGTPANGDSRPVFHKVGTGSDASDLQEVTGGVDIQPVSTVDRQSHVNAPEGRGQDSQKLYHFSISAPQLEGTHQSDSAASSSRNAHVQSETGKRSPDPLSGVARSAHATPGVSTLTRPTTYGVSLLSVGRKISISRLMPAELEDEEGEYADMMDIDRDSDDEFVDEDDEFWDARSQASNASWTSAYSSFHTTSSGSALAIPKIPLTTPPASGSRSREDAEVLPMPRLSTDTVKAMTGQRGAHPATPPLFASMVAAVADDRDGAAPAAPGSQSTAQSSKVPTAAEADRKLQVASIPSNDMADLGAKTSAGTTAVVPGLGAKLVQEAEVASTMIGIASEEGTVPGLQQAADGSCVAARKVPGALGSARPRRATGSAESLKRLPVPLSPFAAAAADEPAGPTTQTQDTTQQLTHGPAPGVTSSVAKIPSPAVLPSASRTVCAFCPAMLPHAPHFPKFVDKREPYEPSRALPFIDPRVVWLPVPANTGFGGYWMKIVDRSSPLPMPIDVALGASWLARKAHESIKGLTIRDDARAFEVLAKVSVMGASIIHKEVYPKDGTTTTGLMRRDVLPGRIVFACYYTTRQELVLVADMYSLTGHLDRTGIEVVSLQEDGGIIRCLQAAYDWNTKKPPVQEFVGRRAPPK